MNPRTTWTLLILSAGLFAFIFFVERHWDKTPEGPAKILSDFKAASVKSVSVRPADQLEIRAERTDGGWELTKPLSYPAQSAAIDTLLLVLEHLPRQTHIGLHELKDQMKADEQYGFNSPYASIIIEQGDTTRQIKIGSKTAPGDQVFLQVVGSEGIDVVSADLLKIIPTRANQWRSTTFVDLKDVKLDRVIVTNGTKVVELQRTEPSAPWRLTRLMPARADNAKMDEALQKLQVLSVVQFVSDDPKADLEPFGLQPAELELALGHGTNPPTLLQFGKSPTNHADLVYARRADVGSIVLVPKEPLSLWRSPYQDFRERHLVTVTPSVIDEITVNGKESFVFQRQTNQIWRVLKPEAFPADTALANNFLNLITQIQVTEFVKDVVTQADLPTYGLAQPFRQYLLTTTTNVAGGATNQLIVQLDFGSIQGEKMFVRRTDETSVYAIKATDVLQLPSEGWQIRDRHVWNFTENDVTRVIIQQDGRTRELTRSGTNKWSLAPGSQGIFNEFAIEETVHGLGELTAVDWLDRSVTNRAAYGFTTNSHRVTLEVRKGDKPESFTVEFGGFANTDFPRYPFAAVKLDGKEWIFIFPWQLYEKVSLYLNAPGS